jgi:hypothetical protein
MRRTVSAVALLLAFGLSHPLLHAADDPKSATVIKARQAYEDAVKKAQAEVTAAQNVYLATLDAALLQAMKNGDLDEANRIDALRKAVRAGGTAAAPGGALAASAKPAAAGNNPRQSADARRKPGWIVGRVTDSAGNPIKGAELEVSCYGTTLRGGERSEFRLEVDDNGNFEQELPDGLYACTAYVYKNFEGSRFRQQLFPLDEKPDQTKLPSKAGIVKDFQWRLTGLRPGGDPKHTFAHYGGVIRVNDSQYLGEDNEKLAARYPDDTQVVITLTPRGPFIDGTKGGPVEIKSTLATVGKTIGYVAMDIPIGTYTAAAKAVTPDGKETPLKCSTEFRGPFKASTDFVFEQPGIYDSVREVKLYVNP